MSTEMISLNPALDVELGYRREVMLEDARRARLARDARGTGRGLFDRLRRRRVVIDAPAAADPGLPPVPSPRDEALPERTLVGHTEPR